VWIQLWKTAETNIRKQASFRGKFNIIPGINVWFTVKYTGCFIMYSGITNIHYRKSVRHVFTKPVQIEGTTQNFFSSVSCFSSQFTFLPLGDASVCSEKMAAPGEKLFCVLEYHTSKSVVTVQSAFRAKYAK